MKKITALAAALVMAISLAGCTKQEKESGDSGESTPSVITVTDHAGNTVEVPSDIKKIAVCGIYPLPSVLAIFFDSAEKIAAMPSQSMTAAKNSLLGELYPEILNADTAAVDELNTEELMKINPDVVFYSASDAQTGKKLTDAGFAAVGVSVNKWEYNCVETLNQWINLIGEIFPENSKGKTVSDYSDKVYKLVQDRVKDLKDEERANAFFLFQYNESSILTSGDKFFGDWWAEAIGANNVAHELSGDNAQTVNLEQIYSWNPDLIFITNFTQAQPDDLYNNTVASYDWSGVKAVADKRVFKMPLGMYRSYTPGADTPITLLCLAKMAYPKLFEDIDITKETVKYYKDVFGVELTDNQAESIFAPPSEAGSGF